jgi:hypothetical protein
MPALFVVLHCRDCAQPTSLTLNPAQPAPALTPCRICGGGRWRLMLGRVVPAEAQKAAS